MIHQADLSIAIAKGDEVFSEQAYGMRLTVTLNIRRFEKGNPVQAH
jgi:hypothetical protein